MSDSVLDRETYGVLVGWSHHPMGERIDLKLQRVQTTRSLDQEEVDAHHFVMTRQQAAVLANYLYKVLGLTPPSKKGVLQRWLG